MHHIDGCVFPFPAGNFSVSRAVFELKETGFSGAVLIGQKTGIQVHNGFTLYPARYITHSNLREIQKECQKSFREGDIGIVRAGESGVNRSIITTAGVNVLTDLHSAPKNAFDRVCAQLAADRGVALDMRVKPLWELRGVARQRVIRTYEEILLLQNRYEFPLIISSGAHLISDLRSRRAIECLLSECGMETDLIERSWQTIPSLIEGNFPVQEIT